MIGIVDSGLGGLTVARAVRERLAEYDIVFYGDTARAPYGDKSLETIARYALEGLDFIARQGALLVIMACSASAGARGQDPGKKFEPPIIDTVNPAAELSVAPHARGTKKPKRRDAAGLRIGVVGAPATIDSGVYARAIKSLEPRATVYELACPLLEPLAEEGLGNKPEARMMIKKCLHPLKVRQIDTLILGSAAYGAIKRIIQPKIGRRVRIIDPSEALLWKLAHFLETHPEIEKRLPKEGKARFFASDITDRTKVRAKRFFGGDLRLEPAQPDCGARGNPGR